MKDTTNADYAHAKGVSKDFEIKNCCEEYHDLYVQSDTYLRTFKICVLKYMSCVLLAFLQHKDWHGKQSLKDQSKIISLN